MTEAEIQQLESMPAIQQMAEAPPEEAAAAGPVHLAKALLRRWKLVAGVWLLLAVPSAFIIHKVVKPTYTAIAQIEVAPVVQAILYSDEDKPIPMFDQYLNTQASIAMSQDVLNVALSAADVQRLAWVHDKDAVGQLRENLEVSTVPKTQIVQISVKDKDPDAARLLANAVLLAYKDRAVDRETAEKENRRKSLQDKLTSLDAQVANITAEIDRLARNNETSSEAIFEQMRKLEEEVNAQTRQELLRADRRVLELEHQVKMLDDENAGRTVPEDLIVEREHTVNNDPGVKAIRAELDEEVTRLTRLRGALPAGDPRLSDLEKKVATLRERLEQQRQRALVDADRDIQQKIKERARDRHSRLEGELALARQSQAQLKKQVDASDERSKSMGRLDLQIKARREQKNGVERDRDAVSEKLKQLEMESRRPGRISIASAAEVRPDGIDDKRKKAIPGAIAGALAFALALGLLRDRLDTQLRNTEQMEGSLGLRLLGAVPSLKDLKAGRITREHLLESYRLIRTTLVGTTGRGRPPRSILVTSAYAAEGKTSLAVSLALSLAEPGGRVLLIDGDIQGPQIGRLLKLNPPYSLRDALLNQQRLADCVARSVRGRFDVLVARTNGESARGALNTQSAAQLVRAAADAYDHVVIDSPPALGAADALAWAQAAEAVVLSSLVGHSDTRALRLVCQRLTGVGARVIGSVMANVSTTETFYSYSSTSSSGKGGGARSTREYPLVQLPDTDALNDSSDL